MAIAFGVALGAGATGYAATQADAPLNGPSLAGLVVRATFTSPWSTRNAGTCPGSSETHAYAYEGGVVVESISPASSGWTALTPAAPHDLLEFNYTPAGVSEAGGTFILTDGAQAYGVLTFQLKPSTGCDPPAMSPGVSYPLRVGFAFVDSDDPASYTTEAQACGTGTASQVTAGSTFVVELHLTCTFAADEGTATTPTTTTTFTHPRIPRPWQNCRELNAKWRHGVGRHGARDKHSRAAPAVTGFTQNTTLYKRAIKFNAQLDSDHDGIACEKR